MTFTTTRLVNNRVSVRGTDINGTDGECVLDSRQWDELAERAEFTAARAQYDATVRAFYAPITEANEALDAARSVNEPDPLTYLEFEAGVESTPGRPAQRVQLTHDSQVLRLLVSGNTDRVVWVDGMLEITDTSVSLAQAVANVEQILGGVEVETTLDETVPLDA